MKNLKILIYGATGGIGQALCQALQNKGANLYIVGRNRTKLKNLARQLNISDHQTFCVPTLTKEIDISLLETQFEKLKLQFDMGFHCAGVGNQQKANKISLKNIKSIIDINLVSAFTFYSIFSRFKNPNGYELVYIGSASTDQTWPKNALYGASKAGLEYFSQSLQKEVSPEGGRVWLYKAGSVNTGFFNNLTSHLPAEKMLQPDELADFIIKNFSLDKRIYIPALSIRTD